MRQILFKAKTFNINGLPVYQSYWVEGLLTKAEDGHFMIQNDDGNYFIDRETVCQFTGQADKNRNKIFEGDKLSNGKLIFVVEWNAQNTKFCLNPIEKIGGKLDFILDILEYQQLGNGYYSRKDLEIIGNIHD